MPVVVNDFEVVADAPAQRAGGEGKDGGKPSPCELDVGEVAAVLRGLHAAALRTWAH